MKRWYAALCKPLQDARAEYNLCNQGYHVLRPLVRTRKRRRQGGTKTVTESLFPRYLFIHLDDLNENWAPIRSTLGVSGLVRFGGRAVPVPDTIMQGMQLRLDRESGCIDLTRDTDYRTNQPVRITSGPFVGHEALFLARSGEERVIVLLDIMQRAPRLKLPERMIASA